MRMGFFLNYKDIKAKKEPRIAELLSFFYFYDIYCRKHFSDILRKDGNASNRIQSANA